MAKWQMILSEFDIIFTTQKAVKGQAIADHLAENPRDDDYQSLHTYFPDKEILFIEAVENMSEQYLGWRLFFDGASNSFGAGIGAILVSPERKHYPATAKLRFSCTNNMAEYETYIFGLKMALDMEIKDLIAFSDSDLLVHQTLKLWVTRNSKIMLYHYNLLSLANKFRILELRHIPRTRNAFADALAILFSMIQHPDELVVEPIQIQLQDRPAHCLVTERVSDTAHCLDFVRKCVKCQMHGDVIRAPPTELHSMTAPWPCSIWGMDVIGTIDPPALNGHRFILVAIEYFTKWIEAASYKHVTKKVVSDFLRNNIICRFGVPETLITDNAKNINNDMVDGLCEQLKIRHRNSAIYRPQMNGAVEATNKNLKKIIRKMTETHRD
ncbi:uncharacterized protein [Coffea arabica]|uniref:Integrase catalytic domain-containing protein n=1 Tax=Coffea arabica TaxID=13443 RepID=A0ABM4VU88_COFAR